MRKYLVFFAAVLAIGGFVFADDISSTKHNLSTSAITTGSTFYATGGTGADQVCVFCHTPHSADQSKGPLWNRAAASANGGWTMYTSSTLNMAAGVSAPLGVSNACMSCHDGVTAFDVIVNAPGSGNYTAGGADRGWTFNTVDTLNSGIASFGNDLRSEHPISFQYVGNTTADPDFNNPSGSKIGQLPLYNTGGSSNYIECGTCHNPHDNSNGTFLRISNAASQLCTTCHIK